MIDSDDYIIFHINSDPNLDLIGTAVVEAYKKANSEKKVVVVTNNIWIWLHNPNVYRVYSLGQTPYFHDDYVKDKKTTIFAQDPRKSTEYIRGQKHIIEIWCEMCGVKYNNEKPSLYFTQREEEVTKKMLPTDQPMFLIQTSDLNSVTWTKSLPPNVALEICRAATEKGYIPVQIRHQNYQDLIGYPTLNLDPRKMMCALKFSKKRLLLDSFLQHASAGMNIPSVVTWITGNPKLSSYDMHEHTFIRPNDNLKVSLDSYSEVFEFENQYSNLPIDTSQSFNVKEILNKLDL